MAIQADRYGFQGELFNQYNLNPPPNLNTARKIQIEQGRFSAYCVCSDQGGVRLGVIPVEDLDRIPAPFSTDLREISRVVHTILENKSELQDTLEEQDFGGRVGLYCHLNQIASYIDTHNRRVESNFWVQLVNVILLVLTLGIFSYKDQLLAKELVVSLKDLASGSENNGGYYGMRSLPLNYIVGMEKSDREFYLQAIGDDNSVQNNSGTQQATLDLLDELSSLPQDLLAPYTLENLPGIAEFLRIPPEQVTIDQLEDPRRCALLMTKLSPHVSEQHLEGEVKDWNKLPFDQLRRMNKEQFIKYVDAFSRDEFPEYLSFFPWSVRKYALENSTTLMVRNRYYSRSSSMEEGDSKEFSERKFVSLIGVSGRPSAKQIIAACSLIAELNQATQAKVPGEYKSLLPLAFFQNLDWANMPFEEMQSELKYVPEGFFAHIPFGTVKAFLEECCEEGVLGIVVQKVQREIDVMKNGVWTKQIVEEPVVVRTGNGPDISRLITPRIAGALGIDWFLETPGRAFLFEMLVVAGKVSGDVSRFSSAQLRQILGDSEVFPVLQDLFSDTYWNSLSADEILLLDRGPARACIAACSDQKLREIIERLNEPGGNGGEHPIWEMISSLRLCDTPSLQDILPDWIQEQNRAIRAGRLFLQNNQQLSDQILAKKIQEHRESMSNQGRDYPFFWLGLQERTHETYGGDSVYVKQVFRDLEPGYDQY